MAVREQLAPFDQTAVSGGLVIPDFSAYPVSPKEFDLDGIQYEIMRWPDSESFSHELARRIRENGQDYDIVVAAKRGGIFPGQIVAEDLGLEMVTYWPSRYQGVMAGNEAAALEITVREEIADPEKIKGKRVLWIDDVNHNSNTIQHAREYLTALGAAIVSTGVLHQKPSFVHEQANFFVRETDAWIIYAPEHLGSVLHDRWEFFAEKFPVWILRKDGQVVSWYDCLERAKAIGFTEDELPDLLDDGFRNKFLELLGGRFDQMPWKKEGEVLIPNEIIDQIFPS